MPGLPFLLYRTRLFVIVFLVLCDVFYASVGFVAIAACVAPLSRTPDQPPPSLTHTRRLTLIIISIFAH